MINKKSQQFLFGFQDCYRDLCIWFYIIRSPDITPLTLELFYDFLGVVPEWGSIDENF